MQRGESAVAIDELLRLVAPPERPIHRGAPRQWEAVQQALGTRLPSDLRDFGTVYGSGRFGFGHVFNPFSPSFLSDIKDCSRVLREERGVPPGAPYGIFPDPCGWLVCGYDFGGDVCWVTEGDPDSWPILVISRDPPLFQQFNMSLTSFLAGLVSGEVHTILNERVQKDDLLAEGFRPAPPDTSANGEQVADPTPAYRRPVRGPGAIRIEWLAPDSLSRPIGARSALGPFFVKPAHEDFTVYPTWWDELPEPREQWVRHPLLGCPSGGRGGEAMYNLVPLTRGSAYRLSLAERSSARDSRFLYRVKAVYEGTNRYPARIKIDLREKTDYRAYRIPGAAPAKALEEIWAVDEIPNTLEPCADPGDPED
jgi:hypothetical protein